MPSISVNVDIDMDEIDTDDLVEEICRRFRRIGSRKSLSDEQKKELKESFADLGKTLLMAPTETMEINIKLPCKGHFHMGLFESNLACSLSTISKEIIILEFDKESGYCNLLDIEKSSIFYAHISSLTFKN